ncbi:hypothetical protein [Lactobacillus johnsonii]
MSKKFKGFLKKRYVGSITEVQKHPEQFYQDFCKYVYQIQEKDIDDQKLSRFVELIRITDIYIDDEGNIINPNYDILFDWILNIDVNDEVRKQIINFKKGINYLSEMKKRFIKYSNPFEYYLNCFQSSNYKFKLELNKKKKKTNECENIENNISIASFCFRKIKNDSLNLELLNNAVKFDDKYIGNIFSHIQFAEIVKMWKFSEAKIYRRKNKIIVDNINDYSKSFVVTRNINQENRNLQANYSFLKNKDIPKKLKIENCLKGLGEEFFKGLDEKDKDRLRRWKEFKNFSVYGISIERWIEILVEFKEHAFEYFSKTGKYVAEITKVSGDKLGDYGELNLIANVLNFKNDFLDTPFFTCSGRLYVYLPAVIICDPVHVMHVVLKYNKDTTIQNMRGNNFEETIGRLLEKRSNLYCKAEKDKNSGKDIKIQFGKKQHEIDLIVEDDEGKLVSIECKTFMDPFNYRDYRIELDKMYANDSNGYLESDNSHYKALKNGGYKMIKRNVENSNANISKNKSLRRLFSKPRDWNSLYAVFLTNLIFPKSLIKKWNKTYCFNFVHWFELHRLINKSPLNEDVYWTNIDGYRVGLKYKKFDINFNGFTRETIEKINDVQPLSRLVEERRDIKFNNEWGVVSNKLTINELEPIKGIIIRYYE